MQSQVLEHVLPFPNKIRDHNLSLSDHEAVLARIKLIRKHVYASDTTISGSIEAQSCDDFEPHSSSYTESVKNLKESIALCNSSLQTLMSHRNHYTMMAIGVIVILINIVEVQAPFGFQYAYLLLKFLLCGLALFFVFMASLWNVSERNGIMSGKLAMEIALNRFEMLQKNE